MALLFYHEETNIKHEQHKNNETKKDNERKKNNGYKAPCLFSDRVKCCLCFYIVFHMVYFKKWCLTIMCIVT